MRPPPTCLIIFRPCFLRQRANASQLKWENLFATSDVYEICLVLEVIISNGTSFLDRAAKLIAKLERNRNTQMSLKEQQQAVMKEFVFQNQKNSNIFCTKDGCFLCFETRWSYISYQNSTANLLGFCPVGYSMLQYIGYRKSGAISVIIPGFWCTNHMCLQWHWLLHISTLWLLHTRQTKPTRKAIW